MCDATASVRWQSRPNHGEITGAHRLIELSVIIAGVLLVCLLALTFYAAIEYQKQLRKAKKEYEKARGFVEDIVLSFNRQLKNEAARLEGVTYKLEETAVKTDAGLKELERVQNKVQPLEGKVEQLNTQLGDITSAVSNLSEANMKTIEELSNLDVGSVATTVREILASQETLKADVSALQEQIRRRIAADVETGNESTAPQTSMPVLPLRRDKAMAALTDTEVAVLEFLSAEGSKTAPEIKQRVLLSREHTSRLMKKLYEEGYLERETGKLPFKYRVKEEMARLLKKTEPPAV